MINVDDYTNENIIEHNSKWPYIPDHPYRILIIGGSGSGKTNALLNLINNQPDIDKIYLYPKDPYETKYQYLINKREKVGLDHVDDPKAFMEYSNDMQHVHKNIDDYNPRKKRKVLIVFDDMIADMINNKKLNSIITELFIRGRKLNIYNKTMTIEDQIKVEKLQYDINREAAKISALSSGKIDKYEYLTGEEILPSNQRQAKFTYSPLGKAFEKQTKTIEDQGKNK